MENGFYCLLLNDTALASSQLELNVGSRKPLFEEDVAAQWRAMFRALEPIDEPVLLHRLDSRTVQAGWEVEFDHSAVHELIAALEAAGCSVLSPVLWLESGELLRIVSLDCEDWCLAPVLVDGEEQLFDDEALLQFMVGRSR